MNNKMAIRAAVLIREHVSGRDALVDAIRLPEHSWQQVQRLKRQAVLAHEHGWCLAEKSLFRDLADALRRFQYELEGSVPRVEAHREPRQEVSTGEVFRDILALDRNSMGLRSISRTMSFRRDRAIVLEDTISDEFEIRLDWSQIGAAKQPYRVVALDPHPAARNQEVTHPHVQEETPL